MKLKSNILTIALIIAISCLCGCATEYDSSGKPYTGKEPELKIWDISDDTKLKDDQLIFLQQCYMSWEINNEIVEEEDFTKIEIKGFWIGIGSGVAAFFATVGKWLFTLWPF